MLGSFHMPSLCEILKRLQKSTSSLAERCAKKLLRGLAKHQLSSCHSSLNHQQRSVLRRLDSAHRSSAFVRKLMLKETGALDQGIGEQTSRCGSNNVRLNDWQVLVCLSHLIY